MCTEVLEHLRDAQGAVQEISRVLAPTGRALISVPFVHELHEWPNDRRRFTIFGIIDALDSAGLCIEAAWYLAGPTVALTDLIARGLARQIGRVGRRFPAVGRAGDKALVALLHAAAWAILRRDNTSRWASTASKPSPPITLGYVVVARSAAVR
jgi:SAM-dependent methyltransferase